MLVLIMLTFSCHALCNCQGARGSRSEPSQPDAGMGGGLGVSLERR